LVDKARQTIQMQMQINKCVYNRLKAVLIKHFKIKYFISGNEINVTDAFYTNLILYLISL